MHLWDRDLALTTMAAMRIMQVKVKLSPKAIAPKYGPTLLQLAKGFPSNMSNTGWANKGRL